MHSMLVAAGGGLAIGYGLAAKQNIANQPPTVSYNTAFIVGFLLIGLAWYLHQRG